MRDTDQKNICPHQTVDVMWDDNDVVASLRAVRKNAEDEGQKAINWYWRKKPWKSNPSQAIRFSALILTAAAGIVPVIVQVVKSVSPFAIPPTFDSGSVATLCVGIAAALIGLDKAFGYSSGWTRYVLTATNMTKLMHEFRMDWVAMVAASAAPPTLEEQAKLIQRAKDFVSEIQGMVLQETKDWATEFQSNMAQMEKELKTQLDTLKAQVEQAAKEKEIAAKPGAIELTLTNADKTDGFHFDVSLEGATGKFTDSVSNAKVWTRIDTAPGQYKLSVDAKAKGSPVATSAILDVKAGETCKPSLTLPIA
ncbi:MAG TPA: SLATT domain-containing protein [Verrucomicrobiae bacterium]|nr:SLATT domain-containing protein [Verrucomicrobiae bacterium]